MTTPAQVMAAEWSVLAIAYILVGLRVVVRVTLKQKHLLLSDLLLLAGLLFCQGLLICDTLTYQMGAMHDITVVSPEVGKIRFATNYLFDTGLYLPKLSMLAIYFQLFPQHNTPLRWALYFVTIFTISSALITTFLDTFWCGPDPSVNWSGEPGACSVFEAVVLMKINWAFCITSEAMLFLLPFPILRGIRLPLKRQRAGLALLFALGIITMSVSVGRFLSMLGQASDILSVYIWATTEFAVSIMIVAGTALRPLLSKVVRATTSKVSSSRHKSGTTWRTSPRSLSTRVRHLTTMRERPEGLAGVAESLGSEMELGPTDQNEISKTVCISVSTGEVSEDGGARSSPTFDSRF